MYHLKAHLPAHRGLLITLAALFLVTAATLAFSVYTLLSLRSFIGAGTNDIGVAMRLQHFIIDLQTAESAQRGYIISNDDGMLQTYHKASAAMPQDLRQLQADPVMKAVYPKELKQLQDLTTTRKSRLDNTLAVLRDQGRDAALAIPYVHGRETTDQIRGIADTIVNTEVQRIIPQQRSSDLNLDRALVLSPLLALFVLLLCLVIIRYFQKAIDKERAIEGSKNEFLSLASHQLRTPATNVKQYIHLVLDGYFGEVPAEQRQALETANRNNDIEISIVNALLDIAKVDLDQIIVKPEAANAGRLVRQVIKEFRWPARKRGQTITYREPRGVPKVLMDQTYFKTVVQNLVDNATKYSPPHSPIRLVGAVEGGRYLLRISDEGVGMSRQDQSKLFKKFSRIPNALGDAVEGSGLGLYWVKRIVELHRGSISVESRPSDGTTFTIKLPLAPTTMKKASPAPLSPARPA